MWLFGVPKSSIAIIIIAILLFDEMNAIASLKLQSFNSSKAHLNLSSANGNCCPTIARKRIKKFIFFDGVLLGGLKFLSSLSFPSLSTIAGLLGAAGLGLSAGLLAGLGSRSTKSSQNVINNGRGSPHYTISAGTGTYCLFVGYGYNGAPYYFTAPCSYYYYYYG